MADNTIVPVAAAMAGANFTWTTPVASDNYLWVNSGNAILVVRNTNASTRTLTIKRHSTFDGEAVADRTITIPALTALVIVGPFPTNIYNAKTGGDVGKASFSFNAITDLTFALFSI